jgi:MbtH protein
VLFSRSTGRFDVSTTQPEKEHAMANQVTDESEVYSVLLNDEGQHSLWPDFCLIPAGWKQTGTVGSRQQCLDWINTAWVNMQPKSLVKLMNAK